MDGKNVLHGKCQLKRLLPRIEDQDLIQSKQLGVRKGYITIEQIRLVINNINIILEEKK